ncbi:hypothetical protein MRX96_056144 [Rhipicephalus microplus]
MTRRHIAEGAVGIRHSPATPHAARISKRRRADSRGEDAALVHEIASYSRPRFPAHRSSRTIPNVLLQPRCRSATRRRWARDVVPGRRDRASRARGRPRGHSG